MSTGSFHSGPPNRCNHRIIDGTSPAGPRSHIGLGAAPRPRRHPVRSSRRNDAAEFAPFALQERPPPPPRHGTFLPCTIVACRNRRAIDVTVLPIEAGDFGHATVHRCRRVGNRVGRTLGGASCRSPHSPPRLPPRRRCLEQCSSAADQNGIDRACVAALAQSLGSRCS